MGERLPCKQDVVGSIPTGSTGSAGDSHTRGAFATVAQQAEQPPCKRQVEGSMPSGGSSIGGWANQTNTLVPPHRRSGGAK